MNQHLPYKKSGNKGLKVSTYISSVLLLLFAVSACEKEYFPIAPKPHVSVPTATLEAGYTTKAITGVNDAFWKTADYLKIKAQDISIGHTDADGLLNRNGLYAGVKNFDTSGISLKAAYDNKNVYILVEWVDTKINANSPTWLYNGPSDPLKSSENPALWTSQRNSDKVSLAFDIGAASGAAGTFANVGCQAACHGDHMKTQSGSIDVWNWDLATSEPLGYAHDMNITSSVLGFDAGQVIAERNAISGTANRQGPAFEWNGVAQAYTKANGTRVFLDPTFYLIDSNKTAYQGDIANGEHWYQNDDGTRGQCFKCHGNLGDGNGPEDAGADLTIARYTSVSRGVLYTMSSNPKHQGSAPDYWGGCSDQEKMDIVARLRGFSGVPGYVLKTPTGSNADIMAISNTSLTTVAYDKAHSKYQVLFTRKLETGNADDIQFTTPSGKQFPFGIAVMNNDGANHVGSYKEILTFKSK